MGAQEEELFGELSHDQVALPETSVRIGQRGE